MTTVHPRRALAEAEAAAWLELHSDWCRGLPAEVRDTSVIGELFHPLIGDGWTTQSWHQAPQPGSRRFRHAGTREHFGRTFRVERMIEAPAVRRAPVRDCSTSGPLPTTSGRLPMPVAGEPLPLRGRALRVVAQQDTEQLRPVTVTLGHRVPGAMTYDRHSDQRGDRCATHSMADLSGHADFSWMFQLAEAELLEWLRLEAGLTALEIESLQQRAAGVAQLDRSGATLARARRRAQAALLAR